MVFSISTLEPRHFLHFSSLSQPSNLTHTHLNPFLVPFPSSRPKLSLPLCYATKSETSSSSASNSKKKKKKRGGKSGSEKVVDLRDVEIVKSGEFVGDDEDEYDDFESSKRSSISTHPTSPLPKPPAGFVVDETGKLLFASDNRIATIIDSSNNNPLECVIRRIATSSRGDECMLLCPVDTPVQILKSTNIDGWSAVSDEEVEAILPSAAYALAKIHMHLVHSGFCYTARGGFCYSEDDIFDFRTDDGQDVEGLPAEGVEITSFNQDGGHYMIYTPSDPLLFVAVKDQNGVLQIADDELLDDPAIISAIDEETEFNALVEEEAALLDSLMGKT